jgi:predicted murein hydrolase (TIGR00659 family)
MWARLSGVPLLWLIVTLLAYQAARAVYRRSNLNPCANPVLLCVTLVGGLLLLTGTPHQTYFDNVRLLHVLLGPATVALAIPLHDQLGRLKTMLFPLLLAVLCGSMTAIASAVSIGWALGASPDVLLALAPKSATMAIAIGIADTTGAPIALFALTVTMTGISGAVMARGLLGLLRIDDPAVRGVAIGTTAHAIGTAQAFQENDTAGAFAALAMGLTGILTALLVPTLAAAVGRT